MLNVKHDPATIAIEYGDSVKALRRAEADHNELHDKAVMAAAEVVAARRRMNACRRNLDAALGVAGIAVVQL